MAVPQLNAPLALELMDAVMSRRYRVPLRRGPRLRLSPKPGAPDASDPAAVAAWVAATDVPTAIDLFCGAGGLSLGLQKAGFRILVGADTDALAVETHTANLGGLGYTGDLTDPTDLIHSLKDWGIRTADLLAGGVPCQPFSRAGQSKIRSLATMHIRPQRDPRAELWASFIEVAKHLRPRAVLLENVPDLAQWEDGAVLVGFCESLRELGYETEARVLNAFEYGVPQHRSRLFIIGIRTAEQRSIQWPAPDGSIPTLWDAISDLPDVPPAQREQALPYQRPRTELQRLMRIGVPEDERDIIWDHITRDVRPDDREAFRLLPEGGTYLDIPEHLRRYRSDIFTDKYKRLSRNELSRTITAHVAKDGYWYIHPTQDRTLSVREAARVQTFPDWFRFAGEPSHRLRQIGNAVPPLLAEALGRALRETLLGEPSSKMRRHEREGFQRALLAWHQRLGSFAPWRTAGSAWAVLVGEVCLRRAKRDVTVTTFDALITVMPTPDHLVADRTVAEEALAKYRLGSRLQDLYEIAQVLVDEYGGRVPDTRGELLALPHVGDYLASAVLCFGYGQPAILMDVNTERIVSRVRGSSSMTRRWQLRLDLHALAGKPGPSDAFNSALLELGASVCQPALPRCLACPVRAYCATGTPTT